MKIWIVSINDEAERIKMRAFVDKEVAVAEMKDIQQTLAKQMRYTTVILEEVDDLLVVAFYSDEDGRMGEKAVMTELPVE
jgi:hypothetical protein